MRCQAVLASAHPGSVEAQGGFSLCERALERAERNVRALVNLSFKFIDRVLSEQSQDREADIRKADELVSRALAIDPNGYGVHFAKSEILLGQERFEEAIVEAERTSPWVPVSSVPTVPSALQAAFWAGRKRPSSILTRRSASAHVIRTCTPFI